MKPAREGINPAAKPSGTGCVECLAQGRWWFHLRRCAECGHIGCCDSSPNRHASKHYATPGTRSSRASSRASIGFTTTVLKKPSPARSFGLLTRIRRINRHRDRSEGCHQTGKRCFTGHHESPCLLLVTTLPFGSVLADAPKSKKRQGDPRLPARVAERSRQEHRSRAVEYGPDGSSSSTRPCLRGRPHRLPADRLCEPIAKPVRLDDSRDV
jgi:hypothetical protein